MAVHAIVLAILLGAGVMLVALVRVRSVLSLLDSRQHRRYWQVMSTLMVVFFAGYLVAAGIMFAGFGDLFRILVGIVFLAGAVFVLLVVNVGYLSIRDLTRSQQRLVNREDELERLYEITDVLNRVLRHNLRNRINVILGRSELVRERIDTGEHHLDTIEQISRELVETSQKARDIQVAVDEDIEITQLSTTSLVNRAVRRVGEEFPDATVSTEVPADYTVEGNVLLHTAVEYVLDNAVRHHDDEPSVSISVSANPEKVRLEVSDDGPGIPTSELESIREAGESPMRHGSGLGLWIVRWILDLNDGQVEFENVGQRGTTVTLVLPRSTPGEMGPNTGTAGTAD